MRAYFYVDEDSGGSTQLMRFRANSTTMAAVIQTAIGLCNLLIAAAVHFLFTSSSTLPLDSWHCIELRAVIGTLELMLFGLTVQKLVYSI